MLAFPPGGKGGSFNFGVVQVWQVILTHTQAWGSIYLMAHLEVLKFHICASLPLPLLLFPFPLRAAKVLPFGKVIPHKSLKF